jgi:UDP-N-acetylmuramate dehydrogenase
MPRIYQNTSLKPYNTFGVEAHARYLASFSGEQEVRDLLQDSRFSEIPVLLLGGGSNMLFTRDFEGLVLVNRITGIEVLEDTDEYCVVKAGAGENWDELVGYCVNNGWGGLENLSYIPGSVGASPIQNIGAYGAEVKDTIQMVHTLNRDSLLPLAYNNQDCRFDYRNSIFKNRLKDKRIITHVTFKLSKKPQYNIDYGSLKETVEKKGKTNLQTIRDSVIEIRRSKLPEPEETGSAGSFFKNPVVGQKEFKKLQAAYPNMPSYRLAGKRHKIPAGWLIDQLGWKGYREGDAGVHARQALVLVNYGQAGGREIYQLSQKIRESVQSAFGIKLEYEVNIL